MRRAAFAFVSILASVIPAYAAAQQSPATITRDRSKIVLSMPGLQGGREIYQYMGWDARYHVETSYAAQVSSSGNYPRAQVYVRLLSPGIVWTHNKDITEQSVKSFAPFFKDRAVRMTVTSSGGGNEARRFARFEVDNADCILFHVTDAYAVGGSAPTLHSGGGKLTPSASGIYCGAQGAKLTDTEIAAVFNGYQIIQNPGASAAAVTPPPPAPTTPPALVRTPSIPQAALPGPTKPVPIPFAASWEGVARLIAGSLQRDEADRNVGEVKATLPDNRGSCTGKWHLLASDAEAGGTWTLSCDSGLAASGTFKPAGVNRGSGQGFDAQGRRIEVNFGQ